MLHGKHLAQTSFRQMPSILIALIITLVIIMITDRKQNRGLWQALRGPVPSTTPLQTITVISRKGENPQVARSLEFLHKFPNLSGSTFSRAQQPVTLQGLNND